MFFLSFWLTRIWMLQRFWPKLAWVRNRINIRKTEKIEVFWCWEIHRPIFDDIRCHKLSPSDWHASGKENLVVSDWEALNQKIKKTQEKKADELSKKKDRIVYEGAVWQLRREMREYLESLLLQKQYILNCRETWFKIIPMWLVLDIIFRKMACIKKIKEENLNKLYLGLSVVQIWRKQNNPSMLVSRSRFELTSKQALAMNVYLIKPRIRQKCKHILKKLFACYMEKKNLLKRF